MISGKTMDEEKWKDCRLHTWVLQAKGPTQNRESPPSTLLFLLATEITLPKYLQRLALCYPSFLLTNSHNNGISPQENPSPLTTMGSLYRKIPLPLLSKNLSPSPPKSSPKTHLSLLFKNLYNGNGSSPLSLCPSPL